MSSPSTTSPIWTSQTAVSIAYSPEDGAAFVGSDARQIFSDNLADGTVTHFHGTTGLITKVAVSPDGLVVAVADNYACSGDANTIQFFNPTVSSWTSVPMNPSTDGPIGIAFAPQSAPQSIALSEMAGGATNPGERAVAQGMNDVVTAGTPSDAPGASAGVDTANLAYSFSFDSMNIPDLGVGLDQSASYDSARVSVAGLLGKGWTNSYGITATQNSTTASPYPCGIVMTQENGSTITFLPSAAGPYSTCPTTGYQAQPWVQATLSFVSSCNGTHSCYKITRQSVENFYIDTTNGELVKEVDRHTNTVTITWGSHGSTCPGVTSSEPCQVTGADGVRTLTFSYPSPSTATCPSTASSCVVVTDPLGRTITYSLNSYGQLTSATLASSASSATYAFSYVSTSSSLMSSWCDPLGYANGCGSANSTTVAWSGSTVSTVTGPTIANATTPSLGSSLSPVASFTRTSFDTATGNGTVQVTNADFNHDSTKPGASLTLDTYANYQLVSSVVGYGAVTLYGATAGYLLATLTPSEVATPMRDSFNSMPEETMDARADTNAGTAGTITNYDPGITLTNYDANANQLSVTDPSGNTKSATYNAFNEVLTSTDSLNNTTTNTYNSVGDLLSTTAPKNNGNSSQPVTSNWYSSTGELCARRDAIERSISGPLSSCVATGNHATVYAYDAAGDLTTTTMPVSSPVSTTQNYYDADGNVCGTLNAVGYALAPLTSCPSTGTAYATVHLALDVYNTPTKVVSSLNTNGTTFATTYTCENTNGDVTVSVNPLGSSPNCATVSPTSAVGANFTYYDANGDVTETVAPFATSGVQGATTITAYDSVANAVLTLSPQGYVVWVGNNSADLSGYETSTVVGATSQVVLTAPTNDATSNCVSSLSPAPGTAVKLCPDATASSYNANGDAVAATSPSGDNTSNLNTTSTKYNPDGSTQSTSAPVNGVSESTANTYDANGNVTNSVTAHSGGSGNDSQSSSAYDAAGNVCWTAPTNSTLPVCSSVPTGQVATVNYYDLNGHLIAEVGPGGATSVYPGATCSPLAAFSSSYASPFDTTKLCSFTTYYVFDELGRLVTKILPSTSATVSGYVGAGATTSYTYDADNNIKTVVNPAGATTTNNYDASDKLINATFSDIATKNCDASTHNVCYTYNADGTRATMVDSSGTTTYTYDNLGRIVSTVDGNSKTVTESYNLAGQRVCLSYPGYSSTCSTSGAGTNSPPSGDVTYNYDAQGRISSVVDWNGDGFTYGYDCAGNVAWLNETPSSAVSSVTACHGAIGDTGSTGTPSMAAPGSGVTDIQTLYTYSTGANGNQLIYSQMSAQSTSSTALLSFGSSSANLLYDANGNLTSSTPYKGTTAQTADTFNYDNQQRVISGPSDGANTPYGYSYANAPAHSFKPSATVDGMGFATLTPNGGTVLGVENAGDGSPCWNQSSPSTLSTQGCSSPNSGGGGYQSFAYDASGNRVSTTPHGIGANSAYLWNQDAHTLTCANMSGTTCTSPSSSTTQTATYVYNADGLRMQAATWNASTSAVQVANFTWDVGSSALLSDGSFSYLYGSNPNVPLGQIDATTGVASELLADTNSNIRAVVEITSTATNKFVMSNYTDYSAFGSPLTGNGGTTNPGGLTNVVSSDPDTATRFGFGGGYLDSTGFIYLINRYYDVASRQFISVDPEIGKTGTPYAYAGDNPLNNVDYLGLWWCLSKNASGPCPRGYTPSPPWNMKFPLPNPGSKHSPSEIQRTLAEKGIEVSLATADSIFEAFAKVNYRMASNAQHISAVTRAEVKALALNDAKAVVASRILGGFATGFFEWENSHNLVKTIGAGAGAIIGTDVGAAFGAVACSETIVGIGFCAWAAGAIGGGLGGWLGSNA